MQAVLAPLVFVAVLAAPLSLAAQQSLPEFTLRSSEPARGSRIRESSAFSKSLPFNRRYAELSAEQKASRHSMYEDIAEGDEPPFPLEGLRPVVSYIERGQQKLLVEGDLKLLVTVSADGTPLEVKAFGSPSPEMTKFASQVLLLTKYKPAICGGKPCEMQFPLYLRFDTRH